jgi:hypothetical protein
MWERILLAKRTHPMESTQHRVATSLSIGLPFGTHCWVQPKQISSSWFSLHYPNGNADIGHHQWHVSLNIWFSYGTKYCMMNVLNSTVDNIMGANMLDLYMNQMITMCHGCVRGHRGWHPLDCLVSAQVRHPRPFHRANTRTHDDLPWFRPWEGISRKTLRPSCLSSLKKMSSVGVQGGSEAEPEGVRWYVSNVSIIFDAPCLFLHHLLSVLLHFVVFLCIFRN